MKSFVSPVSTGEILYKKYCKACHGKEGDLKLGGAPDLTLSTLQEEAIINILKYGKGNMVAYDRYLSEKDMKAVTDFVITLKTN